MVEGSDITGRLVGQVRFLSAAKEAISGMPQVFSAIRPESLLHAVVVRSDQSGAALIKTPYGELNIKTKLALTPGSSLVLRVIVNPAYSQIAENATQTGTQDKPPLVDFQARIVSVNGKLPDSSLLLSSAQAGTVAQAGILPEGSDLVRGLGSHVQGSPTFSGKSEGDGIKTIPTEAAIIKLSKGMHVEAKVLNPEQGAGKFLPSSATNNPVTHNNTPSSISLRASDAVRLHILATDVKNSGSISFSAAGKGEGIPAAGTTSLPAAPLSAQVPATTTNPAFTGVVIGTEKSGETVIKTQIGMLKLPIDITLPKGTQLLLEVTSIISKASVPAVPLDDASEVMILRQLTGADSGLGQLAQLLKFIDAEIGTNLTQKQFSQVDKFIAARSLWFMHAINVAKPEQWLHPQVKQALQKYEKQDIISKLRSDFLSLQQLSSEPNAGGWHTKLFPLLDGNSIHYATIYTRYKKKRDNDGNDGRADRRFVIEVELDEFGEIQIDGLYHIQKKTPTLNIIIRTKLPFSSDIQNDIINIFGNQVEINGFTGQVSFKVVDEFPVHPQYPEEGQGEGSILA